MKKYTKFLVVSIVLFLCVIAFSSCNNVDYELTDGTLLYREVEGGYEVTGIADENATEIKIPYFFKLKKVVSIGDGAFYENSNIVSVIIPNSVKEIGYYNFTYCDSLEYIEVPSSVERIRQGCFKYSDYLEFNEYDNGKYLGNERNPYFALVGSKNREITSCKVNEKCKIIAGAFQWCENLETVEIPDGVKVIDEY